MSRIVPLPATNTVVDCTVSIINADGSVATFASAGGSTTVSQATASNLNAQVVGDAAAAAPDSGKPVKIGGVYNTTAPTYTDGQRGNIQINSRGEIGAAMVGIAAVSDDTASTTIVYPFSSGSLLGASPRPLANANFLFDASGFVRQRTINGAVAAGTGTAAVSAAPHSVAAGAITPVVTTAAASSLVLKNSAGNFYGANITTGGTAGYLMLFDATSPPTDGAVTPIKTWAAAANSTVEVGYNPIPVRCATGITLVFSSTGPFTKTASATAFMSGEAV